ncbi:unnamed protein product [Amoebophrya sp. A120]|nr:unnamed protein product [Amoebophrya sp. A120]|eukprot:GSA120T00021848001.1
MMTPPAAPALLHLSFLLAATLQIIQRFDDRLPFAHAFEAVYPAVETSSGPFLYLGSEQDSLLAEELRLLRIKHLLIIASTSSPPATKEEAAASSAAKLSKNSTAGTTSSAGAAGGPPTSTGSSGSIDVLDLKRKLQVLDKGKDRATYEFLLQSGQNPSSLLSVVEIQKGVDWLQKSMEEVEALPRLPSGMAQGHVLVVSKDGCTRAGTIAAAWLLKRMQISAEQAIAHVRQKRDCFAPTQELFENLLPFEEIEPPAPDENDSLSADKTGREKSFHEERRISTRIAEAHDTDEKAVFMKNCEMIHDAFWFYGDLEPLTGGDALYDIPSATDCCAECDKHPECYKWSYGLAGKDRRKCFLKRKTDGYVGDRTHFVSGKATKRTLPRSAEEL